MVYEIMVADTCLERFAKQISRQAYNLFFIFFNHNINPINQVGIKVKEKEEEEKEDK